VATITINVVIKKNLCIIVIFKTIHFWINPIRGGVPAIDKIKMIIDILFIFVLNSFKNFIFISIISFININVIMEYKIRYIHDIFNLFFAITIIHPI